MNNMSLILIGALLIFVALLIVLVIMFANLKMKESQEKNEKKEEAITDRQTKTNTNETKIAKEYEPKSIFDFMEFESVKDNMIVQKEGKRFLMAIECQGLNYDLMSDVEKVSTEQGFANFLNILKEPIQIYIQTRTVNLEKNIQDYKKRLNKIKEQLNIKEYKYKKNMEKGYKTNEKELRNQQFEILREKNLYSYGQDIITNTEKMSLNKNVLKKKYYIIIKYFYESIDVPGEELLSVEEIRDTAFSNLYTKASSLIRVLSGIGIVGKTLNSFELVDLLYNAYNRDDSEVFGIDKAIEAGYNDIYIDSQSIIDKKIKALNKEIEIKAREEAKNAIDEVFRDNEKELKYIEDNIDVIIEDLAKKVIEDEITNVPMDIKKKAVKKLQKTKKE